MNTPGIRLYGVKLTVKRQARGRARSASRVCAVDLAQLQETRAREIVNNDYASTSVVRYPLQNSTYDFEV